MKATPKIQTEHERLTKITEIINETNNSDKVVDHNQIHERQMLYEQQDGKCARCKEITGFYNMTIKRTDQPSEEGTHSIAFLTLVCEKCK